MANTAYNSRTKASGVALQQRAGVWSYNELTVEQQLLVKHSTKTALWAFLINIQSYYAVHLYAIQQDKQRLLIKLRNCLMSHHLFNININIITKTKHHIMK